MKIGEIARATGTKAELIRYYEKIGLLPDPGRTGGNYRLYGPEDRDRLTFIRHARDLGFDIGEIRSLLGLAGQLEIDHDHSERVALDHLQKAERKISQLKQLRSELKRVISRLQEGKNADLDVARSFGDDDRGG